MRSRQTEEERKSDSVQLWQQQQPVYKKSAWHRLPPPSLISTNKQTGGQLWLLKKKKSIPQFPLFIPLKLVAAVVVVVEG